MRELITISGVSKEEVGEQAYVALFNVIHDKSETMNFFGCSLPRDDPRAEHILQILAASGMTSWIDRSRPRKKTEYVLRVKRDYEPSELRSFEFLELRPPDDACNYGALHRNNNGEIVIPERQMPCGFDVMFGGQPYWYFVNDKVKERIERGRHRHALFHTTVYVPEVVNQVNENTRYWELDSDFRMPPLSPSMTFCDGNGHVISNGDFSNGFHRSEGLYEFAELRYRAQDIRSLQPFDLARTFEPFSNQKGYDRFSCPIIASQRFYSFCQDAGIETGWIPVRIE